MKDKYKAKTAFVANIEEEDSYLTEAVTKNALFQDFLFFMREVAKRPLELTKTGNLKRAEIDYFGQHFVNDIYHRDEKGNIIFPIRTEDEAPYLIRIRVMASAMRLVRKRKEKVYFTKQGKAFFIELPPLGQFEEMVTAALALCNWGYLHPALFRVAHVLQKNQEYLWQYMVQHKDEPIDFSQFVNGVSAYFGIKNTNTFRDDTRWGFERVIVRDLCLYGLLEAETKKVGWDERIVTFKPTPLGVYALKQVLLELENFGNLWNKQ